MQLQKIETFFEIYLRFLKFIPFLRNVKTPLGQQILSNKILNATKQCHLARKWSVKFWSCALQSSAKPEHKTASSTEKNFHVVEHVKRSSKSPQFSRLSSLHEGEGLILFSHTESIAADRIELYGRLHCSKLKHFKRSLWSHLITCCTEASHFYSLLTVWQKSVTHWMWNLCGFHIIFRKNILLN